MEVISKCAVRTIVVNFPGTYPRGHILMSMKPLKINSQNVTTQMDDFERRLCAQTQ